MTILKLLIITNIILYIIILNNNPIIIYKCGKINSLLYTRTDKDVEKYIYHITTLLMEHSFKALHSYEMMSIVALMQTIIVDQISKSKDYWKEVSTEMYLLLSL
jgi:hypothetical protein